MADDNEKKPKPSQPEATVQAEPALVAADAKSTTAGVAVDDGKSAKVDARGATGGKTVDAAASKTSPADADKLFDTLDKALKATDWSWKAKQGDDRELGRLSYINAQNSWVAAATSDHKRANDVWLKTTRRSPSAEMENSLKAALAAPAKKSEGPAGPAPELDPLAAMAHLSKRRDLSENKVRKTSLRSSLGEWSVMRGDAQQRATAASQKRMDELITAEPNKDDNGLHLLKSMYKGLRTNRESVMKKAEKFKSKMAGQALKGIHQQIGSVTAEIKKFETELDIPMDERDTTGIVGRSRKVAEKSPAFRRGAGAATVLAKVTKAVAKKTSEVAKGAAIQAAAISANPGTVGGNQGAASYQARMAGFHNFQRSQGMGPPN